MADQPLSCLFIIRRDTVLLHEFQNDLQDFLIHRYAKGTIRIRNDIMSPACVKSDNRISLLICSERELCFITVSKRMLHTCDRIHNAIYEFRTETADPFQVSLYFLLLKCKLPVIDISCIWHPPHRRAKAHRGCTR